MRYTPAQVKEALDLPEETFRYWRKKFPPLEGKRGYAPCFSPGDLLALKVVVELHTLGVSAGALQAHSTALFKACSRGAWFALQDKALVLDATGLQLVGLDEIAGAGRRTQLVVPLAPLIEDLRVRLSDDAPRQTQAEIAFPPMGVARGKSQ